MFILVFSQADVSSNRADKHKVNIRMTLHEKIFLILIVFGLTSGLTAQRSVSKAPRILYDQNKKYSVEELQFDLAILKDALVKCHPGLYWYQTEKEFEDNYSKLKNSIVRPMTEAEFLNLITPFVANIKCGHTDTYMSEAFFKYGLPNYKVFPFDIKIIESKIYLIKNYSGNPRIEMGSEILSINGLNTDSILVFLLLHQWADGYIESYDRIEHFFQSLLSGYFNYPEKYVLNTKDMNGNLKLITIEALNYKVYEEREKQSTSNDKPFKFSEIDSLSTGIIKITTFKGKGYYNFLAMAFKTIENKGHKNLIIDLRGNPGGQVEYGKELYSYIALKEYKYTRFAEMTIRNPKDSIFKYGKLPFNGGRTFRDFYKRKLKKTEKGSLEVTSSEVSDNGKSQHKPKKNNFKGNVFILTDNKSCSASAQFSAIAFFNKRAKFVGRETGGAYCGATGGWEFLLTLPKTGLQVCVPLIRSYHAVEGTCGRGILPEYHLKEDVKDIINNKDADLLFTFDLIKVKK